MDEDIVVTGKRLPDGRDVAYYIDPKTARWYEITLEEDGDHIFRELREPPTGINDDPNDASDTVKVDISDPANQAEALKAAANVMAAIEKLKDALAAADPSKVIWINGTKTTVGEQLAHLENTEFIVTDARQSNGGVGEADYNERGGNHQVKLNFEYFDGDFDGGLNDYADPAYTNLEGLVATVAHELGHVSEAGNRFNSLSTTYLNLQNNRDRTTLSFRESDYWANNEAWAHSYSRTLTDALGLNPGRYVPDEGYNWVSPKVIYDDGGANYSLPQFLEDGVLVQDGQFGRLVDNSDYLI